MDSQHTHSERSARSTITPAHDKGNSDKIAIAVMGVSGSGKSSFINVASGTNCRQVSDGMEVQQQEVEVGAEFMLDGRSVSLIDTPGTDSFDASAIDLMKGLTKACSEIHQRPQTTVHGVVYLHRLVNGTPSDFTTKFGKFKRLCGGDVKNFIIVLWSEDEEDESLTSRWIDPVFRPAVAAGAKIIHHHGTLSSAHHILREICKNHPLQAVPANPGEQSSATNPKSGQGFFSALLCRRSRLSNRLRSPD